MICKYITSSNYQSINYLRHATAGYVGDPKATQETLVSDGWLRTGDLCYIDGEGFLYVVDRIKELIKYKAYQVIMPYILALNHSAYLFHVKRLIGIY